jgi:hypothetical protein
LGAGIVDATHDELRGRAADPQRAAMVGVMMSTALCRVRDYAA